MDKNIKRAIILDNYSNPINKVEKLDDSLVKYRANNPSCIDDITIGVNLDNNVIKDIYFEGEACAITTSVTSILMKMLKDKDLDYVKKLVHNYNEMILERSYDKELLKELNAYDEVYLQPNRITCATLPVKAIENILKDGGY